MFSKMVIYIFEHLFAEPANGEVDRVAGGQAAKSRANLWALRGLTGVGTGEAAASARAGTPWDSWGRAPGVGMHSQTSVERAGEGGAGAAGPREDAVGLAGRGGRGSQADDAPRPAEELPLPGGAGRGRSQHLAPEPGARGRRHVPSDRHPR